ncbi:MAG TPA: chorismate mutase [Planctomycetota bacterium]
MPPAASLDDLRQSIAALDRSLLELLAERMRLSAEVGRLKAEAGTPIVAREVEALVLEQAREYAAHCGIAEETLASIYREILRGSVERQHRVGVERRAARGGRVLAIGGAGDMGRWFHGFLGLAGHQVESVDPHHGSYSRLDQVADLGVYTAILVSVPLDRTAAVLEELVERRPAAPVVEIASIKSPLGPALALADAGGVRVICLHPMFGPGKSPYEALTFVLASRGETDVELAQLDALLQHPYTRVVAVPFERHDRIMGWLLGLAHLNGMLFGAALARADLEAAELHDCASTTFLRQVSTSLSVLDQDPHLYLDIQHLNPHRSEVYAATRAALEELIALVERRDLASFEALLERARSNLVAPASA